MKEYKDDIERYLHGEMTPAEMHALEREALSDPFLADALEGAENVTPIEFEGDVQQLIVRSARKVKPKPAWAWPLRIAAALVVLVSASFFLVWLVGNTSPENQDMAMEKSTPATGDSVTTAGNSKTQNPAPPTVTSPESSKPVDQPVEVAKTDEQAGKVESKTSAPLNTEQTSLARLDRKSAKVDSAAGGASGATRLPLADSGREVSARLAVVTADSISLLSHTIRGKVTSGGVDLAGATVSTRAGEDQAVTNAAGNYQITVKDSDPALVFSSNGYKSKEVNPGQSRIVNADLEADARVAADKAISPATDIPARKLQLSQTHAQASVGKDAFDKYLQSHVQYPAKALVNKVEGRVTVEFTVDASGILKDFKVVKGIGSGCDNELIRLIQSGPAWTPAQLDGHPVDDRVQVKYKFELPK